MDLIFGREFSSQNKSVFMKATGSTFKMIYLQEGKSEVI